MLVQHLLTERIFRPIGNNPEFNRSDIIAAEIEKVLDSLFQYNFRPDLLGTNCIKAFPTGWAKVSEGTF